MSVWKKVFVIILVLIFASACAVGIYFLTNKKTEEFIIKHENQTVVNNTSLRLADSGDVVFNVNSSEDWTVSIFANKDNPLEFLKDGEKQVLSVSEDLTKHFPIKYEENSFKFTFGERFTIKEVLEDIYPSSEITFIENFNDKLDYFTLTVKSVEKDYSVSFNFSFSSIYLDKTDIVF